VEEDVAREVLKKGWTPTRRLVQDAAPSQSERQSHSLLSFFELSKELDYSLNIYDFADRALFNFMGHLGTSRSALWLRTFDNSGGVVLVRSHGIPEAPARSIGECVGKLADKFLHDRQILFMPHLGKVLDAGDVKLLHEREIALLAPILAPDKLLGVVALGARLTGVPYERFELDVLQASVDFFSVALQNSLFSQTLQENNRQLRRANENLKELDRAKTEFVGNMQHELRTPVTVMRMYLESVLEELPEDNKHREHLDVVMKHTDKLAKMIEDLLDFSSLSSKSLEVDVERADITEALRTYYAKRRNGVALELHDFRIALKTNLPPTKFERKRLFQVLDILLDNAVRFTPQGAVITLRTLTQKGESGSWVRVELADNGPGIPEDKLPRLFVPFQQIDGSVTRETSGLGLGLALANRLVAAMGGRLLAASEVGRGTRMSLLVPMA
jgi:signal transduction histidine kinase